MNSYHIETFYSKEFKLNQILITYQSNHKKNQFFNKKFYRNPCGYERTVILMTTAFKNSCEIFIQQTKFLRDLK